MQKQVQDPSMAKVRERFEKSCLTYHELGLKMGYPPRTARQSVWQFLKSSDPRIGMLRKFAKAMEMSVEELITLGGRKGS